MKKSNIINEDAWIKSNSKEENFNELRQSIRELKENLEKLTNVTQNPENKLNRIQK